MEPMNRHTTFRVGGEAQCYVRISSDVQLRAIIPYLKQVESPFFILGNGSNLLVGDKGYEGVILQIGDRMNSIRIEGKGSLPRQALFYPRSPERQWRQN